MIRTASLQTITDDDHDPLTLAMMPSHSETDSLRRIRLQGEQEAKAISDRIDEELRLERERLKKAKYDVKLLLLGQAASGKSTLLKQFQLMYTPQALQSQAESWRTVIYFNVVRSIKHILQSLVALGNLPYPDEPTMIESTSDDNSPYLGPKEASSAGSSFKDEHFLRNRASYSSVEVLGSNPHPLRDSKLTGDEDDVSQINSIRHRLSPLVAADEPLANRLSGGITVSGSGKGGVFVRSDWHSRMTGQARSRRPKRATSEDAQSSPIIAARDVLIEDVRRMLEMSFEDIQDLWNHPTVRNLIAKRRLKLDEWSEFFLNNIETVASRDYDPSIDDILHARIQTMGITEHSFDVNIHGREVAWRLYDVGGARGQRHSWAPYFTDATAIIFMAPVSAFDQYLEEDPRTNRIDDSLQLFTQICSNQLLKNAHLVLFLNKTDILRAKLATGLSVKKYITSFGDRPNDFETVVQYFRAHFLQVHRRNNEAKRVLYTHLTSVVDTKTTQSIIGDVRDSIFRELLKSAALV